MKPLAPQTVAIVGGGIAGLAAAYVLNNAYPQGTLTLFEREARVGGKVRTSQHEGFTFDWGPNGFLTNVPETLDLAKALGLEDVLQSASAAAKHRFIYIRERLEALPTSPPKLLTSNLLSPFGKLRAALELVRGQAVAEEETVYAFLKRHFGKEAAEVFAGVAVTGITAGDAKALSLDALLPKFRQLEREHGSLIKGLIRTQRRAQQRLGRLTSFKDGGIGRLVGTLEEKLAPCLQRGVAVTSLSPKPRGYTLMLSNGETHGADAVILATPAFVSGDLLAPHYPEAAQALKSIPYADVSVFGLGYDRVDVPRPLDGFGFLVGRSEEVRSLGVLWSSSIFPDQAPPGKVMLRVICGGTLEPGFLELSDAEALEVVRRDLRVTMGITAEPELCKYVRWPRGIPQYLLGHREKVARARDTLPPGLHLIGNAYEGVGVNDAVRSARRAVMQLADTSNEG